MNELVADDDRWIDRTLEGDGAAFGHLVYKYQDRLRMSVMRLIGRHPEIDDVIQEAFLRAFCNLRKFRRTCAFYTWLYRIAVNVTYPFRRPRRPMVSIHRISWGLSESPIRAGSDPSRRMAEAEQRCQVHRALARLDADHRQVLVLREFSGCQYAEIAETLGVPLGTVRSRIHRARVQMCRQLQGVLV